MSNLRLVHSADVELLRIAEASDREMDKRVLRSEAAALTALIGNNPYSNFIIKHGVRPDQTTAVAIGRLMGRQVKAVDGTMQPPRNAAERARSKEARRIERLQRRKLAHVARLCAAIDELAINEDDPALIFEAISSREEPKIAKNLEKSVQWLSRFAEEWHRRGKQQQETGGNS